MNAWISQNRTRWRFTWAPTVTAVVAASPILATRGGWAQGTPDALVAAQVPEQIHRLRDKDSDVRENAASTLWRIGLGAQEAVPALSAALASDTDAEVRRVAASALGRIGPDAKAAVPALITSLAKDTDALVRSAAALALGQIGLGTKEAIPALIAALAKDPHADVRRSAAEAIVQIAEAARDSKQTDLIEQFVQCVKALEARSFSSQAARVRTAVEVLRAIRPPWYQVLYEKVGAHPKLVGLVMTYLILILNWLFVLWKYPLGNLCAGPRFLNY